MPRSKAGKSIHRPEFSQIVGLLAAARTEADLTQVKLAKRLRRTQGFVSSVERGDRRLDLLQVYDWCRACGITAADLGSRIDNALARFHPAGAESPAKPAGVRKKPA